MALCKYFLFPFLSVSAADLRSPMIDPVRARSVTDAGGDAQLSRADRRVACSGSILSSTSDELINTTFDDFIMSPQGDQTPYHDVSRTTE